MYQRLIDSENVLTRFAILMLTVGVMGVGLGAVSAAAQTADDAYRFSQRMPAVGTRALGMGGAGGVAGWADPSAMYTNPAGLGYYDQSEISGSLNALLSRDESTFQIFQDSPTFTEASENSTLRLGNFAGVYNFETTQGSLVFALGFNRTMAFDQEMTYAGDNAASSITDTFLPFGDEYNITSDEINVLPTIPFIAFQAGAIGYFESRFQDGEYPFLQAVAPGRQIRQEGSVTRGGSMNEFNFAGASEVAPNIMLGLSANVVYGRYVFEHELTEIDQEGVDDYSVVAGQGILEDFESVFFRERFTSDLTGFNMRFGVSADATNQVRVGFSVETPTWYSIDEEFTNAFIRTNFANGSLTYGDDPAEDAGRGTFDYRLRTPWRISTGVSYNSDPVLASIDVEFVDWTQTNLDADRTDFELENDVLDEEYGYVFNWRGGLEYRLQSGLRLRGGLAYRPDARNDEFTFADGGAEDRSRLFLSAGAGFQINDQITLNFAWLHERSKDQFISYSGVAASTDTGLNPAPLDIAPPFVDEDLTRNQFQIGATYRF
jgi:long-subunit fatty acid transport protein